MTVHSSGSIVSDANLRQIRVLHIVSAGGVAASLQQSLFMPLLTRLPRPRVKSLVACLSPGAVPSAVLRQSGVPTYDLALSRKRFSFKAFQELLAVTRNFRPDVIQAWGHTAQIISALLRSRCDWKPRLIWSVSDTTPLAKNAGFVDTQKLKYAAKFSSRADRIVYTSESAASQHRRVGFPDGEHVTVPPGVDATRFKPDFTARRKLREQLNLPGEAFVVGMYAPFQPEYDHSTLIKAIGELIKTNPNIAVILAGHGVQKGNAPLMALVGGGSLATRVHLLGEWSDISALYNACDVVCSSALNDQSRMNLVMAMLCGVPCVATGMGAQGEVIGQFGVAIEPGSSTAFVKGITRVMQMPPEKRTHMAQSARKHALSNYVYVRSLQKYLQLYYDLIGRQSLVTNDLPTPEIDATLTVPPALPTEAELNASKRKQTAKLVDLSDPESLESKVAERAPEELPKWRIDQEEARNKREAEVAAKVAASKTVGDVLEVFQAANPAAQAVATPMTERARGVADDSEELLSPEMLAADAPPSPRAPSGPSVTKKAAAATAAPTTPKEDAAKQAALKAARMAALQPIAPAAKPAMPKPITKPAATSIAPVVAPTPAAKIETVDASESMDLLPETALMQTPPPAAAPTPAKQAPSTPALAVVSSEAPVSVPPPPALLPEIDLSFDLPAASAPAASVPAENADASIIESLELLPEIAALTGTVPAITTAAVDSSEVKIEPPQPDVPKVETAEAAPLNTDAFKTDAVNDAAKSVDVIVAPGSVTTTANAAADAAKSEPTQPAASAQEASIGELSLMATGAWSAMQRSTADTTSDTGTLNGPQALSLIANTTEVDSAEKPAESKLTLELQPETPAEPKRAANGE